MEIFLGAASFVYTLENLKMDFSISKGIHIQIWLPNSEDTSEKSNNKYKLFTIIAEKREETNCGYISTNEEALVEVFGNGSTKYKTVISVCKKDFNSTDITASHCSISKDPKKRGNIPIEKNNNYFNCRLEP